VQLAKRLLTALILAPCLIVIVLFASPSLFLGLSTAIIGGLAASEWNRLLGVKKRAYQFIFPSVVVLCCGLSYWVPALWILLLAFFAWLFALALIIAFPRFSEVWGEGYMIRGLMGILVLVPFWLAFNLFFQFEQGRYLLLAGLWLVWSYDSGAYFVGRWCGKKKLAFQVSPGKTYEGTIGGFFLALCMAIPMGFLLPMAREHWLMWICLVLLTVGFSIIGDLFESMLKRKAGIKDSGEWLPGHGGLLDRIDSLTAAIPIFALGILLIH